MRSGSGRLAYYDLARDPEESRDAIDTLAPAIRQDLAGVLDAFGRRPVEAPPEPVLPEELRERLEALGYTE